MRHVFRLLALVLVLAVGSSAAFAFVPPRPDYYRWASTPNVSCLLMDDVWVRVTVDYPHFEWDLPTDNVIKWVTIENDVERVVGSFTQPSGIGSATFSPMMFERIFPLFRTLYFQLSRVLHFQKRWSDRHQKSDV